MLKRSIPQLLVLLAFLSACGDDTSDSTAGAQKIACDRAGNAFYFVQSATSATIDAAGDQLRLTLPGVERTVWFTDRPTRDFGVLDSDVFTTIWDDLGIAQDAPAAITVAHGTLLVSTAVALSQPTWDEDTGTLSYLVGPLARGYGVGALAPGPLGPVSVLIDPTVLAADCAPDRAASLVFVQTARSGEATETGGVLELRLDGVGPTLFFADQPDRDGGVIDTATFIADWATSPNLKNDPPNAVLDIPERTDGPKLIAVELSEPRFDAASVTFRVRVLPDNGAVPELPATFTEAALFIDAFPTTINNRITDAIPQANLEVLGDAPAVALGNLYVATAQALANAAHNATTNQQQTNVTAQAATTMGVATLYSLDTASTGVATKLILQ